VVDSTESTLCANIVEMRICASPNHRKLMKVNNGRQITQNITEDRESSIIQLSFCNAFHFSLNLCSL